MQARELLGEIANPVLFGYLKLAQHQGNYTLEDALALRFNVMLPDGTAYDEEGKLVAVGFELDPETGEGSVLVEFPNAKGILRPGLPVVLQTVHK